jgi:SAM-dependent methyltransferase
MSGAADDEPVPATRGDDRPSAPRLEAPALPAVYRDPRHYDFLATFTAPDDLSWYRDLLARFGSPVLELGCGTGRVSLPLAEAGADVTGLDLSRELLAHARLKAKGLGLDVVWQEGDLRTFELGRAFSLVLLPYNAFNHLLTLDDVRHCFRAVQRHMDRSARFVIDTFQPSLSFLSECHGEPRRICAYVDPDGRGRVVMTERNDYDPATQVNRVHWHYEINGRADARVDELVMRIVFPQELDALIELSGFVIEDKWGDYDQSPFGSTSPKQLVVCRRR